MTKDYAPPSTTRTNKAPAKKTKAKPARTPKKANQGRIKMPANAPTHPAPKGKATLILSLVVLIAAFCYGLYFLQSIPPTQTPEIVTAPAKNQVENKAKTEQATKKSSETETPHYEFYDLLRNSEVVTPDVPEYTYKEKDNSSYYTIQTGAFKTEADAEKQRAIIGFQGLKGTIKVHTSDSGTTWYRVFTGPFYSRSEKSEALDKLIAINIHDPVVRKFDTKE